MSKRVCIPPDVVLTPLVLLGATRKLATKVIESTVDALIEELDSRYGDPDLEPDPDECSSRTTGGPHDRPRRCPPPGFAQRRL